MIEKELLEECSEIDCKYELVMAEKKHFSKIHYLISYMHFFPNSRALIVGIGGRPVCLYTIP